MVQKILACILLMGYAMGGAGRALDLAPLAEDSTSPLLGATSATLYCAENGQFLYEKEGDLVLPPASITKLMTALLVLEHCPDLSQKVVASASAVDSIEAKSTHIAIDPGEELSLHDLMGAMLVQSANDASNVLAEHVGGTLDGFTQMMNEKATALGCTNTHFVNASGLDDDAHYTTAKDMARIAGALMQYPAFFDFAGARSFYIEPTNKEKERREFGTKQNFLNPHSRWYDAHVLGGKNGWTTKAHHTLVTFRKQGEHTMIAVVLGETSKAQALADTAMLFGMTEDGWQAVPLSTKTMQEAVQDALPPGKTVQVQDTFVYLPKPAEEQAVELSLNDAQTEIYVSYQGTSYLNVPVQVKKEADILKGTPMASSNAGQPVWIALGSVAVLGLLGMGYQLARRKRRRRR